MRNSAPRPSRELRRAYAQHMTLAIQPNVAVTAGLSPSRPYDGPNGLAWRKGDPLFYEGVFVGLITRLSKKVFSRSAIKRHGRRVKAAGAIEGDGLNQHFHAHLLIRRPDHLSPDEFEEKLRAEFKCSPWLKPDIKIEQIESNWVEYVHKGNPETFMVL
jgi:hypothetical protein